MSKPGVKTFMTKHSPEILTGVGIVGLVGTAVLAVKATPKAMSLIEAAEEEKQEELTVGEKVKVCWKCYVPAVATGVASVLCFVGANSVHVRRNVLLATACKATETAFTEYRDKVVETIGEKQEKTIKEEIDKDRLKKTPISQCEVLPTKKGGNTSCYDYSSGRFFMSDRTHIEKAVVRLNERLFHELWVSVNDFYDELGLDRTSIGDSLGWDISRGTVKLRFDSQLDAEGNPCLVVDFDNPPYHDYDKIM